MAVSCEPGQLLGLYDERRGFYCFDQARVGCECLLQRVFPIHCSKEDGRVEAVDAEQFYQYEVFGQCVSKVSNTLGREDNCTSGLL